METLKAKIDTYIEERSLELLQGLQKRDSRYAGLVKNGRCRRQDLKETLSAKDWQRVKALLRILYCQMETERGYLYIKGLQDYSHIKEYLDDEYLHIYYEDIAADDDF